MQTSKKIISLLLLFIIIASSIGIQGAVHYCINNSERNVTFFSDTNNSCCGIKEEHTCCKPNEESKSCCSNETKSNAKLISIHHCCIKNNFYIKLDLATSAYQYKKIISNIFDFNTYTLSNHLEIRYKPFPSISPFARSTLERNKIRLALLSQLLI